MLSIFRRHLKTCSSRNKGRAWKRCSCPIWIGGSIGQEKVPRHSLNLTSWEAAEDLLLEMKKGGTTKVVAAVAPTTVTEATRLYIAEAATRNLAEESMRLYRRFIGRQLLAWCESRGLRYVKQLTFVELVDFKASWKFRAVTAAKRLELLKAFMRFCVAAGWIEKNPADAFKAPESDSPERVPFTAEEMKAILDACDRYTHHGDHGHNRPARTRAFVLLLRYSGLRIQDAACLERSKLNDQDELQLQTQKEGVPVYVPLPHFAAEELRAQGRLNSNPRYFFWSGNGKRLSAVSSWQRSLRTLFTLAKVQGGHAHRFRHTLVYELLSNGVPMEDVAAILGHTVRVCEKHYAHWGKARQEKLSDRVRRTWPEGKPTLKLVG